MPKFLEEQLRREYGEKSAIPYKVMNSIGAMKGNKETAKGRAMEKKHEEDKHMNGHNIESMRIEVHRGKGGVTGHTVHHSMMPKPASKSAAFMEHTQESYPFDASGHSSTHGDMMAHIGKHLNLSAASKSEKEGGEQEEDYDGESA